jgi:hypothetical protein
MNEKTFKIYTKKYCNAIIIKMSEKIRNQHKNTMQNRPLGQRSLEECLTERELSEDPQFQADSYIQKSIEIENERLGEE